MKKTILLTAALLALTWAASAAAPPPQPNRGVPSWHRRTAIEHHRTERRTDHIAGRQLQRTRERQQRFEKQRRTSQ